MNTLWNYRSCCRRLGHALTAAALCLVLPASTPPAWSQDVPESFSGVLQSVLDLHPAVKAAEQRLAASQAWLRGAGAQPNPQLRLAVPAGDPSEEANSFLQRFEIGGQPGLRAKIAELQVEQANARLLQQRRELGLRAAEAYYSLWSARATERLLTLRLELAGNLQSAARRRLQAGAIAENEYLRTELERAQAQAQLAQARGDARAASSRLNLLLQRPADRPLVLPASDDAGATEAPEPTRESLLQSLEQRPEYRVAQLTAEIASLEADLLGRQRLPDLEFEAYRSSLGHGAEQGLRLSLVLPLWDWGQTAAGVEQRELQAAAATSDALVQRQGLEQEMLSAWELYLTDRERREILRGQTERYARQADLARRGYEAGLLTLLEVLEAQRAYREAMLESVQAEAAFHRRRWDVYWLSGAPLLPTTTPSVETKEKNTP